MAQMKGQLDSWAILWVYNHFLSGWLVSYPYKSRVLNMGYGEDATHCKSSENPYITELNQEKIEKPFLDKVRIEKDIVSRVNWYFSNRYKLLFKLRNIRNVLKIPGF